MSRYNLQKLCFLCVKGSLACLCSDFSSISTVSYLDEMGHHDEHPRLAVTMENTYQLGEIELQVFAHTPLSASEFDLYITHPLHTSSEQTSQVQEQWEAQRRKLGLSALLWGTPAHLNQFFSSEP